MTFEQILLYAKKGFRIYREGWNGCDMWAVLLNGIVADKNNIENIHIKNFANENSGYVNIEPTFAQKTSQNTIFVGWRPTPMDLLANDWNYYFG